MAMTDRPAPIRFTVEGTPEPQPRPRAMVVNGRPVLYEFRRRVKRAGRKIANPIIAWKEAVAAAAEAAAAGELLTGPLAVGLTFLFPRPAYLVWKTKPMPARYHIARPDCDNLAKAVLDACTGILWLDDAQVADQRTVKLVAAAGVAPGVRVEVLALDDEELDEQSLFGAWARAVPTIRSDSV